MQKNQNIEKITFKVVQMKSLAMHITNQKLSFDIFTVGNLQNIFMEHDFYLKRKVFHAFYFHLSQDSVTQKPLECGHESYMKAKKRWLFKLFLQILNILTRLYQ